MIRLLVVIALILPALPARADHDEIVDLRTIVLASLILSAERHEHEEREEREGREGRHLGCKEAEQRFASLQGQPQFANSRALKHAAERAGECQLREQGIFPGNPNFRADEVIERLYGQLLCRPADPQGLVYWAGILQVEGLQTVIQGMKASPEYQQKSAAGTCR